MARIQATLSTVFAVSLFATTPACLSANTQAPPPQPPLSSSPLKTLASNALPFSPDVWKQLPIHLRVLPDPVGRQIRFELNIKPTSSQTTLQLPERWVRHLNLKRTIQDMVASCDGNSLSISTASPGQIRLDHGKCQHLQINYRIIARHRTLSSSSRFEPRVGIDGIFVYGQVALLLPMEILSLRAGVEVVAPEEWSVASNWTPISLKEEQSEPTQEPSGRTHTWRFLAEDLGHLYDSVLVAGQLRVYDYELEDGRHLQIACHGELPLTDEDFTSLVRKLVKVQRRYLPEHWRWPAGTQRLSVIALGAGDNFLLEGSGRRGGFVVETGVGSSSRDLAELLAHEAFHVINGHLLVHHPSAEYTTLWFKEGVTTYIAALTVVQAGLADESWFRRRVSELISAYYSNPQRSRLAANALRHYFWQDINARRLPYDKGALIGLLLDDALTAHEPRQLKTGLVRLFQRLLEHVASRGETYDNRILYQHASALNNGWTDFESFWPRYVEGTDTLPLKNALRGMNLHLMEGMIRVPYFGFQIRADSQGMFITNLDRSGPAALAGLRNGDRLLEDPELHRSVQGNPLRVHVLRAGIPTNITVTPIQGQRMAYRLNPLGGGELLKYLLLLD